MQLRVKLGAGCQGAPDGGDFDQLKRDQTVGLINKMNSIFFILVLT